ncbi:MAG: HEAT repeat domain-containing protein [Methanotrichaceae archaeon]|nr:HEAT repeat domain-containing protein [Methanotrichaceae archaeon]
MSREMCRERKNLLLEVCPYQEYHTEKRGNSSSTEENRDNSPEKNNIGILFKTGEVPSVKALRRLLTDKSESYHLRWRAARALGETSDQSAVDVLSEALNDKNQVVRWEAVVALGKIGGPIAIKTLMKSLDDESYYVCRKAAKLLIELDRVPQPYPSNLEYLMKLLSSGDERVMKAIIKIGSPALAILTMALKDDSFFIRRDVAQTLALFIRGIIADRPRGMDLTFCLARHNFSLKSIAGLFDLRITHEKNLVKKVETTNFEVISKELHGIKILELSKIDVPGHGLIGHWKEAEAKTVDFENILSEWGAVNFEAKGRTLIANMGKESLAIKLGVRPGDGENLLTESIIQNYLHRHCIDLNLSSRFPHPLRTEKCECFPFRLSGIPSDIMKEIKLSSDPLAICYLADSGYFRYLNDSSLSMDEMGDGLVLCSRDLAKLTAKGAIHSALIPLFHNREQINARIDQGLYHWWAKVAGRLDRWRESCQYPNLRLSGLADFEHIEIHSQISSEDLQHFIGNQLLSISLVLGSYFRNRGEFNQKAVSKILRDCFLNYHREFTHTNSLIDSCIDWDYLAFRMSEEMEKDKYMNAIIRGVGLHGENVEKSTGPHLGLFNGPFPLPELIRAIHIVSLFAILEM